MKKLLLFVLLFAACQQKPVENPPPITTTSDASPPVVTSTEPPVSTATTTTATAPVTLPAASTSTNPPVTPPVAPPVTITVACKAASGAKPTQNFFADPEGNYWTILTDCKTVVRCNPDGTIPLAWGGVHEVTAGAGAGTPIWPSPADSTPAPPVPKTPTTTTSAPAPTVSAPTYTTPLKGAATVWSGATYLGVGGGALDNYLFGVFGDGTLRAATVNGTTGALTQIASTGVPKARWPEVWKGSDGYYIFTIVYGTGIEELKFSNGSFSKLGILPNPSGDSYSEVMVSGFNGSPVAFCRRQTAGSIDVVVANAIVMTIPKTGTRDLSAAGYGALIVGQTAYLYRPVSPPVTGQPMLQADAFNFACLAALPCPPPVPISTNAKSYPAQTNNVFSFQMGRARNVLYNSTGGGVSSVDLVSNPANPPAPAVKQLICHNGGPIGPCSDSCWQGGSGMAAAESPGGAGRIVTNWSTCQPAYPVQVLQRNASGSVSFGQQADPSGKGNSMTGYLAVFSTGSKYFAYSIGTNATRQVWVTDVTTLSGKP